MVAEAKGATLVESKKKKKKPQVGTGKAPKSKAKAKVTPGNTGADSATSRSAYCAAKKACMAKLLDLCDRNIFGSFKRLFYIWLSVAFIPP